MAPTPGMPLSRPKEKIKILLLEGISDTTVETLKSAGYTNIERQIKVMPCATHSTIDAGDSR